MEKERFNKIRDNLVNSNDTLREALDEVINTLETADGFWKNSQDRALEGSVDKFLAAGVIYGLERSIAEIRSLMSLYDEWQDQEWNQFIGGQKTREELSRFAPSRRLQG